jgi:formylglycine-generating enzyme required for sulfatase activity
MTAITNMRRAALLACACCSAMLLAFDAPAFCQAPEREQSIKLGELTIPLVYIAPGEFDMGADTAGAVASALVNWEAARGANEGPKRRVRITKGFYIGRYEITCREFCEFLNSVKDPDQHVALNRFSRIEKIAGRMQPKPGCGESAINVVHWQGAEAFCRWLSERTSHKIRLPTEAEWEFAARGPEGRQRPWSDNDHEPNRGDLPLSNAGPVCPPVHRAGIDVTPHAIAGMGSGVGEWCQDYYGVSYLPNDTIDPQGPTRDQLPVPSHNPLVAATRGEFHVLRGRTSITTRREPGDRVNSAGIYGLRIVKEP